MRKLLFVLLASLIIVSCSDKNSTQPTNKVNTTRSNKSSGLSKELYSKVLDYQSKFPVPNNDKSSLYIYQAVFHKDKKDTLVIFERFSAGIAYSLLQGNPNYNSEHVFGIYKDSVLYPTIIIDSKNNYCLNFIEAKITDTSELKKFLADYEHDNYPESFPPIFIYKVSNKNLVLKHIDTVWTKWR